MAEKGYHDVSSFEAIDPVVKFKKLQAGNSLNDYKPSAGGSWKTIWDAKVQQIVHNQNSTPGYAAIQLQGRRWSDGHEFGFGDLIRIELNDDGGTVLFQGFITKINANFSGGSQNQSASENLNILVQDVRWLVAAGCPVYGQYGRSYDDYDDIASEDRTGVTNGYVHFTGRRCIFNAGGQPNKDPLELRYTQQGNYDLPVFGGSHNAQYWSARDMIVYLLSPLNLSAAGFYYSEDATLLAGIDKWGFNELGPDGDGADSLTDFGQILMNLSVEGLSVFEAIEHICKQIGWAFRINQHNQLFFYKYLSAAGSKRTESFGSSSSVLHSLWAPAVGEDIKKPVDRGNKLLHAATIDADISGVVNAPIVAGAKKKIEVTLELVPGWKDEDFVVPTTDPILSEADLAVETDPNSFDFFKYYHARGSNFKRSVARLWVLNETGKYSESDYDRGEPFDWLTVLPVDLALAEGGKTKWGLFEKKLLPCLSYDADSGDSVRYKVEFSFDAGDTWQVIPCAVYALEDQAGIWIGEPNLAEMTDTFNEEVGGDGLVFMGEIYNYWISIALDKLFQDDNSELTWKSGSWITRVRITASVQLDERLVHQLWPTNRSGSPLVHKKLFDDSDKFKYDQQAESSTFFEAERFDVKARDDTNDIAKKAASIQKITEDRSLAGQFALDRLWLVDTSNNTNYFEPGDGVWLIFGRDIQLTSSMGSTNVHPEIVQVVHDFTKQQTTFSTRDLRWSQGRSV